MPARAARLCAGLLLLLCSTIALGQEIPSRGLPQGEFSATLVTYGPGEVYWQRFGHNAIWLNEPELGLNHTFNYGFFDFDQENFLLRFVQGRMLYFSATVPVEREFSFYQQQGREVRVQVLDLDPHQYARLRDFLVHGIQQENREYLYDYYLDNCSTRIRDALDFALEGALETQFSTQSGILDFRGHTRRSTAPDYWYYLGLELALGLPVDRPISRWDEMFIPGILAESLGEFTILGSSGLTALVREDRVLSPSQLYEPPGKPRPVWLRYLALSIGLVLVAFAAYKWAPSALGRGLVFAWVLVSATLGVGLALVWGFTDHQAAYPNLNLLLFNPAWFLLLFRRTRHFGAVLMALGVVGATIVGALEFQYMLDVLALAGPINLACAWWFLRGDSRANRPG